ncbi:HAD-IA family hydrolase [Paenibacillus dendritiformis]|uniref:HAD-superfamily hydrolase n=1 Tax=Paenibacillus dendritiformis C454 TaxID=1131935 RepID=H3SM72_9BACL|nr:HAD-IA family hydrolase [Paenibacillus dendritiformis]EHQ59844.1 HAD-superfamily hydrolase [Paenibacillus dendritiformis C454]CAH8772002.1 HAD-IA family hydrolase [Paenibacillus dendritiformis]
MRKMLLWDFDGTLGYRQGGMWGATMIEALKEYDPDTKLIAQDFRNFLISGFPWHHPERSYTHIQTSEEWWEPIIDKFFQGYVHYGIAEADAKRLAVNVRERFIDTSCWTLFDDTLETLKALSDLGWRHAIVSNHIPELGDIVKSLGLMNQVNYLVNSALVGYEKPNPMIFLHALRETGEPEKVWMIGDNIEADFFGAEAVGIQAILVRNMDSRATRNCRDLTDVIKIVEEHSG